MARCPNCGRETRRTVDWCCQWCGYPLFSGSYKKIDKTYKELKDERTGTVPNDDELDVEDEAIDETVSEEENEEEEPEVEEKPAQKPKPVKRARPEPEPEPTPRRRRRIVKRRRPEPEPEPEPEIEEDEEYEDDEYEEDIEEEYEDDDEYDDERNEIEDEEFEEEEEEDVVIEQPMMELTVDEIVSAYETEGPEADVKFTNKTLRVTGVISRIDVKEAQALFSLTLEAEKSGPLRQSMRCIFSREHGNELQRLIKSQTVTVQGKYDGSIINISMRDCYLVQ